MTGYKVIFLPDKKEVEVGEGITQLMHLRRTLGDLGMTLEPSSLPVLKLTSGTGFLILFPNDGWSMIAGQATARLHGQRR